MAEPTYTWTLRIATALAERVLAIQAGRSYSAWIRQAIEEKLERDEPRERIAKE